MKRLAVPGRTDWRQLVSAQGCTWHDDGKEGCWREDVVWELTRGETDLLMRSAAEVLSLYQQAADHVVRRGLWNRLGFETEEAAIIQASLERRDEAMLGRFDFLMDESGQPRLLEFNADNALSLVESAVLQREWLREVLPGKEQCNVLHARRSTKTRLFQLDARIIERFGLRATPSIVEQAGNRLRVREYALP